MLPVASPSSSMQSSGGERASSFSGGAMRLRGSSPLAPPTASSSRRSCARTLRTETGRPSSTSFALRWGSRTGPGTADPRHHDSRHGRAVRDRARLDHRRRRRRGDRRDHRGRVAGRGRALGREEQGAASHVRRKRPRVDSDRALRPRGGEDECLSARSYAPIRPPAGCARSADRSHSSHTRSDGGLGRSIRVRGSAGPHASSQRIDRRRYTERVISCYCRNSPWREDRAGST